jgi:dTDP-4-dehydrorhamnose 3,5-epimerase
VWNLVLRKSFATIEQIVTCLENPIRMRILSTNIPEVLTIEPAIYADARGFFLETYHERKFAELGLNSHFVQDNQSHSIKGVLRGLHYQIEHPQGKLVRVLQGEIFDVAVDIRIGSATFGKWVGLLLSSREQRMLWIPPGFAHGFYTCSEVADVSYKVTDFYAPAAERTLVWNDPEVDVAWPLNGEPILSDKDRAGHSLRDLLQIKH